MEELGHVFEFGLFEQLVVLVVLENQPHLFVHFLLLSLLSRQLLHLRQHFLSVQGEQRAQLLLLLLQLLSQLLSLSREIPR